MTTPDYSPWISPVTGKAVEDVLPDIESNYVWVGTITGTPNQPSTYVYRPIPSTVLMDMEIDLKGVKNIVDVLERINHALGYATLEGGFPIPNPVYTSQDHEHTTDPLFGNVIAARYIGNRDAQDSQYLEHIKDQENWQVSTSNSVALSQFKTEEALARLDLGQFILKTRGISYGWPNQSAIDLIPDTLKAKYGLKNSYSFEEAQALDELTQAPGIAKISGSGDFEIAISGVDYITPTELETALAFATGALEAQIGLLQGEIALIQWELFWLGVGTLASGLLSLLAGIGSLAALFSSQENIDQINDIISQNELINNIINNQKSIEDYIARNQQYIEEAIGDIYHFFGSSDFQNLIQSMINNAQVVIEPRSIGLSDQCILIGNSVNEAQEVPLDALGLITDASILGIHGDVTFQSIGTSYLSKIRDNPTFTGQSITIPYGNTASRPVNPTIGMLRFNTDLQ